ncbi:hypothetical protein, partial [Klebsiella pneumoniae]|uniref:hypothetical protein n=1 Tax=Klebsiella pneumoniae TaxID=573 RepID=UPI00197A9C2C
RGGGGGLGGGVFGGVKKKTADEITTRLGGAERGRRDRKAATRAVGGKGKGNARKKATPVTRRDKENNMAEGREALEG